MKAIDKIYISSNDPSLERGFMTGCIEKMKPDDVEYIRKDELIEWLLKGIEMSEICHSEYGDACAQTYQAVIDKINSL